MSGPGGPLQIETEWLSPDREGRPLVVFLHEGLGSLSQWRDFPQQLCDALRCRGLLFSRPGYGRSSPPSWSPQTGRDTAVPPMASSPLVSGPARPREPWPQDYLQRQTRELLPAYFDSLGLQDERLFLFGHSDGASLALLFAAAYPARVSGVVAMAPHLFVEAITIDGLRRAKQAFETGRSLKAALARHHADVDSAFYGWNDAWLRPGFEHWNIEAELRSLACPVLALQGVDDEYGSLAQIEAVQRIHAATQVVALSRCGHAPQRDQPDAVIAHTRALTRLSWPAS